MPLSSANNILRDTLPEIETVKFDKVEREAYYPGGDNAWRNFLQQTLHADVPAKKNAPAGTYTVVIQFVVEKDGSLSEYKALTNHGFGMEAEVLRVIKKSSKWVPAEQNGRIVRAYRKQPVTFQVAEEKKKKRSKDD